MVQLVCPRCATDLQQTESGWKCTSCAMVYPIKKGIPVIIAREAVSISDAERSIDSTVSHTFDYLQHYSSDAEHFDYFEEQSGATKHSERRLREYITSVLPSHVQSILDIGCGSAWVTKLFLPKGKKIVSLDASEKNPSEAIKRYPSEQHIGIAADAFALPFKDGSFDAVIAAEIIEHVTDPGAFVAEAFRVVRPGGIVIISTPYKEKLKYELCIHCHELTPVNAHLHSFDEQKLRELLPAAQFRWNAFNNKLLLFTRTYIILQYLPFQLWKMIDAAASMLIRKPVNIVVRYVKK